MKSVHQITVVDGRAKFKNRKLFDYCLKEYEGKQADIVLDAHRKRRSNPQNAYYWSLVLPCALQGFTDAGHSGLTVDDIHEYFKDKYLTKGKDISNPITGEVRTVSKTTTILSTTEMMDYINEIARFCAEMLNVVIPEPMEIFK